MYEPARPATVPHPSAEAPLAPPAGPRAISWPAVVAGAVAAAALSLILVILGTGLGLSSVSPWSGGGASAQAIGASTIAWLAFTQLAAAGLGGYLAGRLRSRWPGTPRDEVYFRDTAHGFLAWALATLLTAAVLSAAIAGLLGTGVRIGSSAATTAGAAAASFSRQEAERYLVDAMFRPGLAAVGVPPAAASGVATAAAPPEPTTVSAAAANPEDRRSQAEEVGRIFASALSDGALPARDSQYLAQLIAQRSGVGPAQAEKRVAESFQQLKAKAQAFETQTREAADIARKSAAHASLWMFIALLLGAFTASLAATWGGRQRDL